MADGLLNKASIILTPTGYKAGTLYNVAPVVEPYEDFDFARASVASRVNSSGLVEMVGRTLGSELVTNGDFSNGTTDWEVEGFASRVVGTYQGRSNVLKVNISNTATASRIKQPFTYVNGTTYKIVVNVYLESGSFRVDCSDTFVSGDFIQTTDTGSWQTLTAYFTAISSGSNYIWLRSLSEVSEFYVQDISVKEIIDTNNIPRISYDSNGDNGHILLEPTSTNLVPYSEDFSEWTTTTATLTSNQSSPDGYNNAYIIEDDDASAFERVDETITTVASSHTFSVFIKKKTSAVSSYSGIQMGTGFSYVIFDSYNGTYNQQSNTNYDSVEVENFSSDWWRLKLTATVTTSTRVALWGAISTNGTSISPSATGSETFYGAQLEALPYATSYIPTLTGSQEIRATETATGAGSADLINSTEGVLYAEIAALADDISGFRVLGISDGGSTNRIFIGYTSNNIYANVGAGTTIGSPYTPTNASNFHKVALKYENNNCKFFVDGSPIGSTTTSITIPSGMNSLQFDSGAGGSDFYGKVKALAVFNEALSDSELTQLTT